MADSDIKTIDEYVALRDPAIRPVPERWRAEIRSCAPEATEKISWQMPTFYLRGNLVHFAAHKSHVGFYPGPEGIKRFAPNFGALGVRYSKGSAQFPYSKEVPWELIREIVAFRRNQQIRAK